jgi:hypothetical protein
VTPWREQLGTGGFTVLPAVFTGAEVGDALAGWDAAYRAHAADDAILCNDGPPYGARNVLRLWPDVMRLARHPALRGPLIDVLGPAAGVVRVLFFDKPPGHSWALPWHKDYNIAVAAHRGGAVFTKPTTKAGVPHVVAPADLLSRMLTARIHLDDMNAENGPLRVLLGSHHYYHQGEDEAREAVSVHCRAGDVLLMRPLLTHASGHTKVGGGLHRRVVHLECAAGTGLADGYDWHDFEPLQN